MAYSLIKGQCQAFCEEFYDEGYDAVVECWDEAYWDEFIADNNIKSVVDFVEAYKPIKEYREEIQNTAF